MTLRTGVVAVLVAVLGSASAAGAGQPAASSTPLVTITYTATAPADALLDTSARLMTRRADQLGLKDTSITVTGQHIVLTGPEADQAMLESLAVSPVVRWRETLLSKWLSQPSGGDARLLNPGELRLFNRLTCKAGEPVSAWRAQAGYTTPADWDNPSAQIVSCYPGGTKYALAATSVLGEDVVSATARYSTVPPGQWVIDVRFNRAATTAYRNLTTSLYRYWLGWQNQGNGNDAVLSDILVIADGVYLADDPAIQPVSNGQTQIYLYPRPATYARELAAQLNSGPLPVSLRVVSVRTGTSTSVSY